MIVTKTWLNSNRTDRGAFTKDQIEALGLKWEDLSKGWPKRIIGKEISSEDAERFERKLRIKDAKRDKVKREVLASSDSNTIQALRSRIKELEKIIVIQMEKENRIARY